MNRKIKKLFVPERIIHSLEEIRISDLKKAGISHLLLDLDNTLVPLKEENPSNTIHNFLAACRCHGVQVHLFSNNFTYKIYPYAKSLHLDYYGFCCKPFPFAYWKFLRDIQQKPSSVLAIGDQIFTDILGAHFVHIQAYYLAQQHQNDYLLTKVLRYFERKIIKYDT